MRNGRDAACINVSPTCKRVRASSYCSAAQLSRYDILAHLDELGIAHLLGPCNLHHQRVGTLFLGQFPLFFISDQLFSHRFPRRQILLVLAGSLHIGDVGVDDTHAVTLHLLIQISLHLAHIAAAQIVGAFGFYLTAAAADGVPHGAA